LTTKNAILIVQFAKARLEEGKGLIEATLEGARLRFRPIIMTSLAFGFGVLPLAAATGAGAGAMTAIGTGVLGGMITGTVLVVIFAPLFYVLIERFFGKRRPGVPVEPRGRQLLLRSLPWRLPGKGQKESNKGLSDATTNGEA